METKITEQIAMLGNQIKDVEELPVRMIINVIDMMEGLGIKRLGLWCEDFMDYDMDFAYNEEDEELFSNLYPDFDFYLGQGGNEDECAGKIFAVELNSKRAEKIQKLEFVFEDTESEDVYRMSAEEVKDNEYGVKFLEVMKAIWKTIQFNIENEIPVEKWGVGHFPKADPYTYEYIAE